MDMSQACTAPVNAPLMPQDAKHPLYQKYLSYRGAMARQMVYCQSFDRWLEQHEHSEKEARGELPYQIINKHPKGAQYWAYMRAYHQERGNHKGALEFDEWLTQETK